MSYKLAAYLVNSTPVSDLTTWNESDLNGNAAFQRVDTIPAGYQDVSSITHWHVYGKSTGADYKAIRQEIKELAASIVWANLTTSEKVIAGAYFVVAKTDRDDVYTTEQQVGLGMLFHRDSIEARQVRWSWVVIEAFNRLPKAETDIILNDVSGANLSDLYMYGGREGTLEGDEEGLFDYIDARVGTTWETTGAAAQTLTPIGMTQADFIAHCMDILKNGVML